MGGQTRLFQLAQDAAGHPHALFFTINHNRHGVQVVLEGMFGPIFGVRNAITNMSHSRKFKGKARHRGLLYHTV